jgi:hypothetical protein
MVYAPGNKEFSEFTYVDNSISDHVLVAGVARGLLGSGGSFGRHCDGLWKFVRFVYRQVMDALEMRAKARNRRLRRLKELKDV